MRRIKLGLLMVTLVGALLSFTGCGAEKIELNDFVSIETQGYDGYGTAKAEIEYGKLEEALMAKGIDAYSMTTIEAAVTGSADKTDGLSNGDSVDFKWTIDKAAVKTFKKDYKINLVFSDFSTKVNDLKDAADFDLADYLDIKVSGVGPAGKLSVSTTLEGFRVAADKTSDLSNGDEVTITVSPNQLDDTMEELCAQNQVPVFDGTYKYTVDGLHNYVTTAKEIPSDVLEILKKKSEEALVAVKEDSCSCSGLFGNIYRHRNFDSYKLVSIGIADSTKTMSATNSVLLVYELSFSAHGDVKTYAYAEFNGIVDSNEGLTEDSFFTIIDDFQCCTVDGKSYIGQPSIEGINEYFEANPLSADGADYIFEDVK